MPRTPDFRYDVFLSYNAGDKPRVRRLAERLKASGLQVWFNEWVIRPGDDIYLAIERGLEAATVQVLPVAGGAGIGLGDAGAQAATNAAWPEGRLRDEATNPSGSR